MELAFIGVLWFTVPYIPCGHVFLNVGFVIAERTLYNSCVGYAIIMGPIFIEIFKKSVRYISKRKSLPVYLYTFLIFNFIFIFSLQSLNRNSEWYTNKRLWFAEYKYCNAIVSSRSLNNLGKAYQRQYKYTKAIFFLKKAIDKNGFAPKAYFNIGLIYHMEKKCKLAKEFYIKALTAYPNYGAASNNLMHLDTITDCSATQ